MGIRIMKNGKDLKQDKKVEPVKPVEKIPAKAKNLIPKKTEPKPKSKKQSFNDVIDKRDKDKSKGKDKPENVVISTTSTEKVRLSYSALRWYLKCPKQFEFYRKFGWSPSKETKKVMNDGLVFEAVVLNDKDGILEFVEGKQLERVVKQAERFNENGIFLDGEAHVKVAYEHALFTYRGELDWIGGTKIQGVAKRRIVDLKWTGRIDYIWQDFKYREDALQIILYSWAHYKNTGEILNAAYVIVEASFDDPVFQIREVNITLKTYEWVEQLLIKVAIEPIKVPNPTQRNCLGGKGQSRCPWLQYCNQGRKLLGGVQTVDTDALPSKEISDTNF